MPSPRPLISMPGALYTCNYGRGAMRARPAVSKQGDALERGGAVDVTEHQGVHQRTLCSSNDDRSMPHELPPIREVSPGSSGLTNLKTTKRTRCQLWCYRFSILSKKPPATQKKKKSWEKKKGMLQESA
jgi:hypothetical protein